MSKCQWSVGHPCMGCNNMHCSYVILAHFRSSSKGMVECICSMNESNDIIVAILFFCTTTGMLPHLFSSLLMYGSNARKLRVAAGLRRGANDRPLYTRLRLRFRGEVCCARVISCSSANGIVARGKHQESICSSCYRSPASFVPWSFCGPGRVWAILCVSIAVGWQGMRRRGTNHRGHSWFIWRDDGSADYLLAIALQDKYFCQGNFLEM